MFVQCMHSLSEYDERTIIVHTDEKCICSVEVFIYCIPRIQPLIV